MFPHLSVYLPCKLCLSGWFNSHSNCWKNVPLKAMLQEQAQTVSLTMKLSLLYPPTHFALSRRLRASPYYILWTILHGWKQSYVHLCRNACHWSRCDLLQSKCTPNPEVPWILPVDSSFILPELKFRVWRGRKDIHKPCSETDFEPRSPEYSNVFLNDVDAAGSSHVKHFWNLIYYNENLKCTSRPLIEQERLLRRKSYWDPWNVLWSTGYESRTIISVSGVRRRRRRLFLVTVYQMRFPQTHLLQQVQRPARE